MKRVVRKWSLYLADDFLFSFSEQFHFDSSWQLWLVPRVHSERWEGRGRGRVWGVGHNLEARSSLSLCIHIRWSSNTHTYDTHTRHTHTHTYSIYTMIYCTVYCAHSSVRHIFALFFYVILYAYIIYRIYEYFSYAQFKTHPFLLFESLFCHIFGVFLTG